MADTVIERLLYRIEADTKQLRSDFAQAQASAQKAGQQIGGSMEKASTRASAASSRMSSSMSSLGRSVAAAAAAYVSFQAVVGGARAFVNAADTANRLENRLKLVTSSTEELTKVQGQLFDVSQATLAPLQGTVELYTRVSMASKTLGTSQQEVLTLTKAVNQAIALSGATASEASAGVIQFAQGLASGRLQGDELRSVLENLPRLGKAIADGMGITIGQLRELGAEGKTVPKEVIAAILREAPKIADEMGKIVPTVEQSLVRMQNAFVSWASAIDDTIKATPVLREFIDSVTRGMEMQTSSLRDNGTEFEKLRDRAVEVTERLRWLTAQLDKIGNNMAPEGVKKFKDEIASLNAELAKNQELQQSIANTIVRFDPSADTKAQQNKAATVAPLTDDKKYRAMVEKTRKLLDGLREDTERINANIRRAEEIDARNKIASIRSQVKEGVLLKEKEAEAIALVRKNLSEKLKKLDKDQAESAASTQASLLSETYKMQADQIKRSLPVVGIDKNEQKRIDLLQKSIRESYKQRFSEIDKLEREHNLTHEQAEAQRFELSKQRNIELTNVVREATERQQDYFRSVGESIAFNFLEGARKGQSAMEMLADFANTVLMEINRNIAKSLAEMAFPSSGGGGLASILGSVGSSLFGGGPVGAGMAGPKVGYAKGGAFESGLHKYAKGGAFSNSVITGPTRFRAANGAGLMGEAGAEAIMPLARTPDGKLGVQAVGGNGNSGMTVFIDARGADPAAIARLERGFNSLNASIENRAVDSVMKTQLRGGNFSRAFA